MAQGIVVKIWNVKAGSGTRSASAQIADSIAYIENPEKVGCPLDLLSANQIGNELTYVTNDIKTVNGLYVGCRHITDINHATEEMMQVKEFFGKLDGRVATHGVISLDEEESDSKNAGKLMLLLNDLMQDIFPQHQVVYAVHANTDNLHIHFIINTVGLDGKKIHMDKKFMREVMEVAVNRLAEQYGFTPNETWKKEKKVDVVPIAKRKILLRKLIDHAIEQTDSFDAFIAYLRVGELTVNVGKHISVQMDDMTKAMRTGQLGENYTLQAIQERLLTKFDPFRSGHASDFYEAILPEKMARITPVKMKKYKDMSPEERMEVIHLLKLKRNPWQESIRDNWQMQKMADDLNQIGYVYKLVHHYSRGTDSCTDAIKEIIDRRKELGAERKELRQLQNRYKPITDIYEEMKKYMVRAYLYDAYGKTDYIAEFMKYRELSQRLETSFGKSVDEVADFVAETKTQIFYLKQQEQELSKQYVAVKKYAEQGKIQSLEDEYSFFHAIGHSEAVYQANKYGIYASELKYITLTDNKDIVIRVMTTPDMKDDKPTITTSIAVMKNGITMREVSSKDMDEKKFNKAIHEIQEEYGIKKCSVVKNKIPRNARQI
ncbi:MAG: relaxase/mobilization nuclease domain-containing protein [Lachnospiraceae bacterium]|nr:relaxase/mobilization nuclease domain-containing protein [Lachnospiraceae bacterium]